MARKFEKVKARIVRPITLSTTLTSNNEVLISRGLGFEVRVYERLKDNLGLHKGELKIHLGDLIDALEITPQAYKEAKSEWKKLPTDRRIQLYGYRDSKTD